jgi:membrane protease YdiL (CAAX protease family)
MEYSMSFFEVVFILSFIICIIVAIKFWTEYKQSLVYILPFFIAGCIVALVNAIFGPAADLPSNQIVRLLFSNLIQLLRDTLLGAAGLLLLRQDETSRVVESEEISFQFLRNVPIRFTLVSVIGYAAYTMVLFSVLSPEILAHKANSMLYLTFALSLTSFRAVDEELFFRLFLIGLTVFLMRSSKYRWLTAIVISAGIWSYGHWFMYDPGWVKFLHVLPLGFVLGYALRQYGIAYCILLHALVNLVNGLIVQFS